MRHATVRSAIRAAALALAAACTGEAAMTIGPPQSTPPAGDAGTPATGRTATEPSGTRTAAAEGTGTAGTGATATGGQRPASIGSSNSGEATADLGLALRLATAGARRAACLRSSC